GRERAARAAVLRALAPLGPGVAFASVPRVGEELRRLALADLRRSSGLALLLVAAVVLASFRGRPGASALSALPLALGCLWTFGLWGAAGRPIDLLCIATLPVLFGTGIDLGVHTLHTARVHPAGVAGAARELGLTMTLTVATTGIGFGSLASSRVPGLRNAGLIVAAGVVLCLLATLTVLPALGALGDRRRGGAGARTGRPPRERPPHAPEIGRAHRLLGRFHFTRVFWYRIHRLGVIVVPQRLFAPGIALFTLLFWIALRRVGAAVAANLEAVLGPAGFWRRQARIYRTLREFAWCLSERYERLALGRVAEVALDGEATWRALLDSGTGFVLLTAHLGPWESGSMVPATRNRRSVHLVREAEPDAEVDRFVRGLLEAHAPGLHVTHFAADNPHLGAVLLDALRAGDIVALQGDRPRAGGRSLEAPLFGRPFPFPVGPAALARAAGVPIVPVFVLREGRLRYRSRVRPPIEVPRTADREADLRQAVAGYAAELEGAIRERPHQWFLFRKVWE
ncbi:MAG TPA: hypothetical protein VF121_16530, partial [Thermoanaerobaculia bacterium]|nr:hypothetical protein [Thermoanaerobaculia bacterium]